MLFLKSLLLLPQTTPPFAVHVHCLCLHLGCRSHHHHTTLSTIIVHTTSFCSPVRLPAPGRLLAGPGALTQVAWETRASYTARSPLCRQARSLTQLCSSVATQKERTSMEKNLWRARVRAPQTLQDTASSARSMQRYSTTPPLTGPCPLHFHTGTSDGVPARVSL